MTFNYPLRLHLQNNYWHHIMCSKLRNFCSTLFLLLLKTSELFRWPILNAPPCTHIYVSCIDKSCDSPAYILKWFCLSVNIWIHKNIGSEEKFCGILLAQNYIQNIFVAKFFTIWREKFKIFPKSLFLKRNYDLNVISWIWT